MAEDEYTKEDFLEDLKAYEQGEYPRKKSEYIKTSQNLGEMREEVSKGIEKGRKAAMRDTEEFPERALDKLLDSEEINSKGEERSFLEFAGNSKKSIRGYIKGLIEYSKEKAEDPKEKGPVMINHVKRAAYLASKVDILHKPYVMKEISEGIEALRKSQAHKDTWAQSASKYVKDVFNKYEKNNSSN